MFFIYISLPALFGAGYFAYHEQLSYTVLLSSVMICGVLAEVVSYATDAIYLLVSQGEKNRQDLSNIAQDANEIRIQTRDPNR